MASRPSRPKGVGKREYYITVSATGQITLPADIRRQVQALGRRRMLLRVVDAERGVYQIQPATTLADLLASFDRIPAGGEAFGERYLREKAEDAEEGE